jgi:hypothetical protein
VFENRVLKRIFGPKRKKKEEVGINCIIRNLVMCICHQNIVMVIRSRRRRWVGHVACIGR